MDDVISEEILGLVHDEHYDPKAKRRFGPLMVSAERKEYQDRIFYVLFINGPGDHAGADLNREGWQQLRELCDVVLTRMDEETR